jgi:hypothetical protein
MLRLTIAALLCVAALACTPPLQRSGRAASAGQLAEFRIARDPEPRDLFADPGLRAAVRPRTDDRFTVVKCDTGFARFTFDGHHQEPSRRVGVEDGAPATED